MSDLQLAKQRLVAGNLTLCIVKDGEVLFETTASRISGFMNAIDKLGDALKGASSADLVAGKAVALLCVYVGISEVYAQVLSKKGQAFLEEHAIPYQYYLLVDTILDPSMTNVCPFEKLADEISNPKDAYTKFKVLLEKFKHCK